MADVYICIATGQPLANLLPILMLRPAVVLVLSSPTMKQQGRQFIEALGRMHTEISVNQKQDLPEDNFEAMQDYAISLKIELEEQYPESTLIYNATGGTKLMTLAFADLFREAGNQICYADTQHQQLLYLFPRNLPALPMGNQLNTETYLLANGLIARQAESDAQEWRQQVTGRKDLTFWLARYVEQLKHFIPAMNRCVAEGVEVQNRQRFLLARPASLPTEPKGIWNEAMARIAEAGLIDRDPDQPEKFYFKHLQAADYLSGKWLEEYAWLQANKLDCFDIRCGLQITTLGHRKDDIRNEIDLVLCHNNRLLVVECKTARFGLDESKDSNLLYKLDSVGQRAGGLYGQKLLLSALPLDHTNKENRKVKNTARADTMAITTLAAGELAGLVNTLKIWMEEGRLGK